MTKLPRGLSGNEVVRALIRAGFYVKRQKGSHIVMRRDEPFAQVVVPAHRSIDTGTLAAWALAATSQVSIRCSNSARRGSLGGSWCGSFARAYCD